LEKQEKLLKFEDGSLANFQVLDKALTFFIQARVLGKDIKTTSTTVSLTPEETLDLLSWLNEIFK
jgi:hypothetical protein